MGTSAGAAAETRKKIVETAAAEFRARGFDGVGVSEVMSQAGLTHGGFYRHFSDKEQLIVEATEECFQLIDVVWPKGMKKHSREGLKFIVTRYLSSKYLNNPAESCAFVMLGSDIARANDGTRAVATKAYERLVSLIESVLPEGDHEVMRQEAGSVACSLIGALSVARILDDKKASLTMMNTIKERILGTYDSQYPSAEKAPLPSSKSER